MFFTSSFPEMETEEHTTKKPKHGGGGDGDGDRKIIPFVVDGGDGSSIEVAKRPRGRPIGSKNKPKPPVIVTRESEPPSAMRPHVLEISAGNDIVASLSRFSTRRNLGVCLLAATGGVSNVTLRQPPHPAAAVGSPGTVVFRGRFEILSISGTFLPAGMGMELGLNGAVTVSLAGPGGQVVGGMVVGPLVAAGTVRMVAAAFDKLEFHRLPLPEDGGGAAADVSVSGGSSRERGEGEEGYRHRHRHYQQQERRENDDEVAVETTYSSHFPGELMWGPTVLRPPPY